MKHETAGTFYVTNNYGIFKKLEGHRDVNDIRKSRISKSIDAIGFIKNPIVVNEKMEIIDGQGRFEVCKEKGLPIYYNIVNIKDSGKACIYMNTGTTNWTTENYVNFYAEKGIEPYKQLIQLHEDYPNISLTSIVGIARGLSSSTGKATDLHEGNFVITEDLEELKTKLKRINNLLPQFAKKGNVKIWTSALLFIYECPNPHVCFDLLEQKIFDHSDKMLYSVTDLPQAFDALSSIYNHRKRGDCISFLLEYKNYSKAFKGAKARYGWKV